MTKEELAETLQQLVNINTEIANKQGNKCKGLFALLDLNHQKIAKALGYWSTKEELEKIGQ